VIAIISLAVSLLTMMLGLLPVLRRSTYKRLDGYNEVRSSEIDLEAVESIALVPLDIDADRSSTEQAGK
jgi:hypothetical protein